MKPKQTSLVVNPRAGQNLVKITDILAVLAAAGWKTDLSIKEYGGHAMELATMAAEDGSDLVIAYGGDGTLNQVINGVMHTKHQQSMIGLIPGGTANVWASEIGVPSDPVKAVLALLDSNSHKVDVGHVEVEGLTFPGAQPDEPQQPGKKPRKKPAKDAADVRQHFLLMAGLGIDAAVMGHVSRPLKQRIGALAVGVSTARELPTHRPFSVEIRTEGKDNESIHWQGEALQVVIGNSRLYADMVEMTPDAYIDDGVLDVCVIIAGNPVTTMQQIASLLLRHKPDNLTTKTFQGVHFSLSVPVSVALQLDGSAVKLKDYLSKADRQALALADNSEQVMVTYNFDTRPHAINIAIPHAYNGALFAASGSAQDQQVEVPQALPASETGDESEPEDKQPEEATEQQDAQDHQKDLEYVKAILENGRKMTVVGVASHPIEKQTYIVAGSIIKTSTGEVLPVAACIGPHTQVHKKTGEKAAPEAVSTLHAGDFIMLEGKKSKRGVIAAKRIVI